MVLDALRQWSRRSLANIFALRAAAVALLSVLLVAGVSVLILLWTEQQAIEATLHHDAQTAVRRMEVPLNVVASAVKELAKSPMFATALLDSGGRAAYARPFLQNYRFPVAAANGLALCDLNGQLLAGSQTLADCGAERPEFAQVLADGQPRQAWQVGNGRQQWLFYQGIAFAYTGTTEGLLVARVDIDEVLRPVPGELNLASVALRASAGDTPPTADAQRAPLFGGNAVVAAGPLELLVVAQPRSVWTKLLPLLAAYLLATLVLLFAIVLRARRDSRLLIEPLGALRDRACEIAVTKDLSLPIPTGRADEVGQLADSIAAMVAALRAAEDKRRESEARFRLIYDKSDEAILFAWPDGRIDGANDAACRLFGRSEAEFRALGRSGAMDTTDPRLLPALEERGRTGTFRGELNCQHADGHIFPVEIVSTLFHDAMGTQRTSNMIRDISKRKQAEASLQAERRRLNDILVGTNVGTWEWNVQTGETVFNERWADILGYRLQELQPVSMETWRKFTDPDDLKRSEALIERHFRGELPYYECEARMRHKDGNWVWVLDRGKVATWTEDGKPLLMSGTHQDITERMRREAEQRESESRFRSYFELGLIGMAITSVDKGWLQVNDRLCDILGYPRDELITKTWAELTHPDDLAADVAQFERVLNNESEGYTLDKRFIAKDGRTVSAAISAKCLRRPDGSIEYFVAMVQDISERVAAERERLANAQRLTSVSRRLLTVQEEARRVLARELHDCTSPNLAAISINMETAALALAARNWQGVAEKMAENSALIRDTAMGIRQICADLRPPALDHAGLVPALEAYVHQYSQRTGIAATVDPGNPHADRLPPEVETMLFRIVQEALTNIAKHADAAVVTVTLGIDGHLALLTVADDGRGFEPTQLGIGWGQGLLTMREMAEFIGGSFELQSRPGHGTRILVALAGTGRGAGERRQSRRHH